MTPGYVTGDIDDPTSVDTCDEVCSCVATLEACFEAAPYVVVSKYSFTSEVVLSEVPKINASGICNAS